MHWMDRLPDVPNFPIRSTAPISARFLSAGIRDWHAALEHISQLPYGRTRKRTDPLLVLGEGRGTCSSKHALLALLAHEQQQPVDLMLGIYRMTEHNTPGVGPVLAAHGIDFIPEAHCYLVQRGQRIDVTRSIQAREPSFASLLHEEKITPEQVAEYKPKFHRRFLEQWLEDGNARTDTNLEQLWAIREQCIEALENNT